MSWFTGNLSTIAGNVSSFTREVLTEASKEEEDLKHDEEDERREEDNSEGRFSPALRDELLFLRSEVSNKDEHIRNLQLEYTNLKDDSEKHSVNLKKHLLEKEVEIEQISEKLDQSEAQFEERLSELTKEKSKLESELLEKMSNGDTESDWDDDWGGGGGGNEQEISILKTENESLNNEVSMKEIILTSIEAKMRHLSGKNLDASDFSSWIDDFMEEKIKEKEQVENLTELVMYLKEEMNLDDTDTQLDMDEFLEWHTTTKEEKIVLQQKIKKLENTIRSVEDSISEYEKGNKFKIADIDTWLESLFSNSEKQPQQQQQQQLAEGNKRLLDSIQNDIREFDEEDENFEIKDFHSWIEKVQTRLDDLEVDLLNEQEMQTTQEKQRSEERTKLKEMFEEKENEIAMLKVELYKSSLDPSQAAVADVESYSLNNHHNPQLTVVQEQLNEATARSEALQNEMTALKSQESNLLEKHQNELERLNINLEETRTKLEDGQNENQLLQQKLQSNEETLESLKTELKLRECLNDDTNANNEQLDVLREEISRLQSKNSAERSEHRQQIEQLTVELREAIVNHQQISNENSNMCVDIKSTENMIMDTIDGEHVVLNDSWKASSEKTSSLLQAVKGMAEHSSNLQQEYEKHKDQIQTLNAQLKEQEDLMLKEQSDLMEAQQLVEYINMMITKMFPSGVIPHVFPSLDGNVAIETDVYENNMAACEAYIVKLAQENDKLRSREDELKANAQREVDSLKQNLQEVNKNIELLQLENASMESQQRPLEAHDQALQPQHEDNNTIENITAENEVLKETLSKLQTTLSEEQQKGIIETENNKQLHDQIKTLTQQISQSESLQTDNHLKSDMMTNLNSQHEQLQLNNQHYQTENQKLTQQLSASENTRLEYEGHVANLNQQLQQYQTFTQTIQAENEHLKQLNAAALTQGPEQEVAMRTELQNQVNGLMHENQHYQNEYENLRQGWIKYQQESNAYVESIQSQYQQLQEQHQLLSAQLSTIGNNPDNSIGSNTALQEKVHNLSLLLTEKAEECVQYQQQNDQLNARLVELQNDTSDMELIREECKQLKTMLMSKDHESRVDETIGMLQNESKQLKILLTTKDAELEQMQKAMVEKENELSDMELLREECKQLKLMLVNKDSPAHIEALELQKTKLEGMLQIKQDEVQQLNASLVDLQNSTSDMELLREECGKLKQMLVSEDNNQPSNQSYQNDIDSESTRYFELQLSEKERELQAKDAIITEMQNTSTDVELLRKQCEQLKSMLSEKDGASVVSESFQNNTGIESSFLLQVQQLEELMREKDDVIAQKDNELRHQNGAIVELENNMSDMELLRNECRALKEMISGKEKVFAELQNDLDLANDIIEQRKHDVNEKNSAMQSLQQQINGLETRLQSKEEEVSMLRSEMCEAVVQDENIHLLQTEYRNVEENLQQTRNELNGTQQKLFEMETHCDRLKVYEEQYQLLKQTLKDKEEELSTLRLQSSETSILESDTVSLLHQELNQLKTIVYEREEESNQLNAVLQKKNTELQNFAVSLNRTQEMLTSIENEKKTALEQVDQLRQENSRLDGVCSEKDHSTSELSDMETSLRSEVERLTHELVTVKEYGLNNDQISQDLQTKCAQLENDVTIFRGQDQQQQIQLSQQIAEITELRQKLLDLESLTTSLEQERFEVEGVNKQYMERIAEQQARITSLESNLQQTELNQQTFLESMTAKTDDATESKEALQKHQQITEALIRNLKSLLELPQQINDVTDLSEIVQKVQWIINELEQKEVFISRLNSDIQSNRDKYNTDLTEVRNSISALQEEHEQSLQKKDFKITDLQSQLQELNELEVMYQQKCIECENLASSVSTQNIQSADSREYDHLRNELAKNSHALLNKNKECDQLKVDIFHLEEKLFNQQKSLAQVEELQTQLSHTDELRRMCQSKDTQLENLRSQLEDSFAMIEGGKKEKEFLDQLVKQKNTLAAEKEEMLYHNGQLTSQLKELEVQLKHKDVSEKEIEVKTKRELERLRNHLMMIEENHTKDILEGQNREEKLRQELDEAKDTLGKKSIILQDSSKQFKDHVETLEEQLHVLAAQRDNSSLDLEKFREKTERDSKAIFNLQSALEQLQKDKEEQYEYLVSVGRKREEEYEAHVQELMQEQQSAQTAMSEASLAVQGISKLQLELEQKDRELVVSKETISELSATLQERDFQCKEMLKASDTKMEKSLIKNLLMKYFQSEENKRSDIIKVIGGLLGMSHDQIVTIGTGAAPSKVGGWISNVWGYATPKKNSEVPQSPGPRKPVDINQSFSELFVKFLETESTQKKPVDSSASLTNANVNIPPTNIRMLSPTTPDILAFHNKLDEASPTTIPAPGQEIPRVHTHHAQSTLKSLLA